MKKNLAFIKVILSIIFCLSGFSFGQETTGGIEGIVKDPKNAVVPSITLTITSSTETASGTTTTGAGAGFRRTITTNEEGFFRVLQVPPGSYNIVTLPSAGFAEARYENITVAIGRNTQLEIVVNPGSSTTTVDVSSSDAPPVDTTSNAIQTTINAQKIELLPKGTGFAGLLRTVPGARPESRSGGFSVDGASGGENVFVVDGQEVTNFRTGTLNETYNIPTQLVQEVQVKSSGFEAQYGGATGGVVSVVTRGGNNDLHGEFGIQFEPSKFRGNPRPDLYRFESGTVGSTTNPYVQTAELIAPPKTGGTDVFYTANLSGPIIKDRVWFYTSYSPQIFNTDVNALYFTNVPAATRTFRTSEPYSRTTRYEYAFGRLDANPFNNLRLTGTYLWNPVIQQGEILNTISFTNGTEAVPTANYGGSIGTLRGNQFASQRGGRQTSNLVTFAGVYTPWNNVVFEGRYNRGYLNEKLGNYFVPLGIGITSCGTGQPAGFGCTTTTGGSLTVKDISIRDSYDFSGTYIFNAGGRHELKGGYQRYKTFNDVLSSGTDPFYRLSFNFTSDLNALLGITKTPGAIGYGILRRRLTFGKGTSSSQGIFIQDKYQPFRRLTLNLGVRTEKENLPSFNEFPSALNFNWDEKIAPRLGFAFDIFGDGKTKAFGSYGRFFDRVKFSLPRGVFGGTVDLRDHFEVFPGDTVAKFTVDAIVGGFTGPSPCPSTGFIAPGALSRCQQNQFPTSNGPTGTPYVGGAVDPDTKPFQQTEFTVGIERQLSQNYLLRVRYTLKNLDEAVEDMQVINRANQVASIVGNPGKGLVLELLQQEGYPKAAEVQRRYDGLEFVIEKRLSNNWYFNANYTYSRLYGNYTGLVSSAEPHLTSGRREPGITRAFDVPLIGFTAYGEPDNGRLPTDRPHVFNIYGAYIFDWNGSRTNSTEISGFQTVTSGTPNTTYIYSSSGVTPQILYGRGDLGRTPVFSQTDLAVTHRYRFGSDNRFTVAFDVNVSNLFDQDTVTSFWTQMNIGQVYNTALGITRREFNIGYQNGTLLPAILTYINARPDRQDKLYNQPFTFQSPRAVRFGFRFLF